MTIRQSSFKSKHIEIVRQAGCNVDDFALEKDSPQERALADFLATLDDLHINYEYVKINVTIGDYSKTLEVGFYLPLLDSYYTFPFSIDKDAMTLSSLNQDLIDKILDDKKFFTGIDLLNPKN